ncbi:MAG: YhhN family protein [Caulobacter sp.]|nr:YhhN family protein [Caulobacter sp.]
MTRDNLAKLALLAALIGGTSYVLAWGMNLPPAWDLAWKGTGVGFLALYAGLRAKSLDGWLLTAVMVFGMLGDVLLGVNFIAGALAFLVGHLVAIGLYLRNRRPALTRSQLALAVLLVPATVTIAYLLPTDRAQAPGIAIYTAGVAAMAACAWISRFPRLWTGLGAIFFLVSDLLIFARMGPIQPGFTVGLAVWGLYLAGQVMICLGVSGTLADDAV